MALVNENDLRGLLFRLLILSVNLSVYLYVCQSVTCLPVCLLSLLLSQAYLCFNLSSSVYVCLFVSLSCCLCLSFCLSLSLFVFVSVSLCDPLSFALFLALYMLSL